MRFNYENSLFLYHDGNDFYEKNICSDFRIILLFPCYSKRAFFVAVSTFIFDVFTLYIVSLDAIFEVTLPLIIFCSCSLLHCLFKLSSPRSIKKVGNHKSRFSPQRVRQPCPDRTEAMAWGLSKQRTTA